MREKTTKLMFMTIKKPQRYAKDNRKAHLTARSDKSVAYVTNNDSTRRFVLLKLTAERNEASRGLFATAQLLVTSPSRTRVQLGTRA